MTKNKRTIELDHDKWREIERVAAEVGALARRGHRPGRPSWRTLMRMIADGEVLVVPADKRQ